MKIDTRTSGASPSDRRPARADGAPRSIIVTSPSAGATISPSPCGVMRTGSRKNAATQIVSPTSGQNRTMRRSSVASSAIADGDQRRTCGPSGCTAGKRHLTVGSCRPGRRFSSDGMATVSSGGAERPLSSHTAARARLIRPRALSLGRGANSPPLRRMHAHGQDQGEDARRRDRRRRDDADHLGMDPRAPDQAVSRHRPRLLRSRHREARRDRRPDHGRQRATPPRNTASP